MLVLNALNTFEQATQSITTITTRLNLPQPSKDTPTLLIEVVSILFLISTRLLTTATTITIIITSIEIYLQPILDGQISGNILVQELATASISMILWTIGPRIGTTS